MVSPGETSHHTVQPTLLHSCSLGFSLLCALQSDKGHLNLMCECSNTDVPKLCCLRHLQSFIADVHLTRHVVLQLRQRREMHL